MINGHLLDLGFKFPELWDPSFKEALRGDSKERAKKQVEEAIQKDKIRNVQHAEHAERLIELRDRFFELHAEADRQAAGRELQEILNRLFSLEGLRPRRQFRIVGEEIDGSFELDDESYLVEAKWEKKPIAEAELIVLRGKIEGKSLYTRGLFISVNGFSEEAKEAFLRGKQSTFFAMEGFDLSRILSGDIGLQEFLRQRRRLLCEEGLVFIGYSDIFKGSRSST